MGNAPNRQTSLKASRTSHGPSTTTMGEAGEETRGIDLNLGIPKPCRSGP